MFAEWIKRNGLTALLITGMLGVYGFFIEARYIMKEHEEVIDELKSDLKNMPKRIIDEVNFQRFVREMASEKRDTLQIDLNR